MIESINFKHIKLSLKQLMLDPNNPRFDLPESHITKRDQISSKEKQDFAYARMQSTTGYEVMALKNNIKNNNYINVDEIMVEKLDDGNYLVREGNRRVTALKLIYAEYDEAGLLEELDSELYESIHAKDMSEHSEETIQKVLGMRHVGGQKEWGHFE